MKHLQSFRLFEAGAPGLTPDQEKFLNACTRGTWSVNPETGLVDVRGNFVCHTKRLKTLLGISFGHVSVDFSCSANQLTTLAGAPQTVDGEFYCRNNQLTTLEGAPKTVGVDFLCGNNQLTSLVGAPQTVDGNFDCEHNQLTSLVGAPLTVGGAFYCDFFSLRPGEWNPSGWEEILTKTIESRYLPPPGSPHGAANDAARELILTLPYLDPAYWLELHRSNRKKFNDIWLGYRQDSKVRKSALFQEVEADLSGRALKNLEDLQDLRDFGL